MKRLDFLKSLILLPVAGKAIIDSSLKIAKPIKVVNDISTPLTFNNGIKVSKQALMDIEWLPKYVSKQMTEDFMRQEENFTLYGHE